MATKERLDDLLENNAEWKNQLGDGLQDLRRHMINRFQEGFLKHRHAAQAYVEDPKMLQFPEKVLRHCEYNIDALMTDLGLRLSEGAGALYGTIEEASRLHLTHHEIESLELPRTDAPVILPDVQQIEDLGDAAVSDRNELWKKSRSAARGGLFNFQAGAVIGGVVGTLIGGGVGFLFGGAGAIPGAVAGAQWGAGIGAMSGFASGAKEGLSQIQEKEHKLAQKKVSTVVNQFFEVSKNACLQTLTDTVTQLERSIRDDFSRQLKQEKNTTEEALKRIQQSSALSRKEAQNRSAALKVSFQKIDAIHQGLESVSRVIFRDAVPGPFDKVKDPHDLGDWADA